MYASTIDALPILQQNIIAVEKCPEQSKAQWRLALTEINTAMNSSNQAVNKSAEIILAFAPSTLFKFPNTQERNLRTRENRIARFAKFWRGDFTSLIGDIPHPVYRRSRTRASESPETN